jgi:hypothetical protein
MATVYSIEYETYELQIYSHYYCVEDAISGLSETALKFMTDEQGSKKAKIISGAIIDNPEINEGYFLYKQCADDTRIEVYYKTKEIIKGYLSSTINTNIKKVKFFSVITGPVMTHSNCAIIQQKTNQDIEKNCFNNFDNVIKELKNKVKTFDETISEWE